MKKIHVASLSAIAAASLLLAGCASTTATTEETSAATEETSAAAPRACVILPDADAGTRWETGDRPALEAGLTAAGFEADIQNALADTAKFATIADAQLAQGCGVMVLVDYQGAGAAVADRLSELSGSEVRVIATLPISPDLRIGADAGIPLVVSSPENEISQRILKVAEHLASTPIGLAGKSLGLKPR
jgi:hypothetical protein